MFHLSLHSQLPVAQGQSCVTGAIESAILITLYIYGRIVLMVKERREGKEGRKKERSKKEWISVMI